MPGRRKINGSGKTSRRWPDVFRKRSGIGKTYPEKGRKIVKNEKTVNGGIRRTKTGREAGSGDRETGRPENRKSESRVGTGKYETVETEKKEKDNSPAEDAKSGEAGRRGRRGDGEEEKRRECRSGADGVEKRVLKL